MSEKDYYKTLGVNKTANEKEIKSAYRKLAKKYHPDTNQGNKMAEQKFKEITEAYNILSDPEKRKLYDQFGTAAFDGSGGSGDFTNSQHGGFTQDFGDGGHYRKYYYNSGNMDDIFGDFFGDMFQGSSFREHFRNGFQEETAYDRAKGNNIQSEITITFEEAAFGCDKILHLEGDAREVLKVHIPAGINEGQSVRLKGKGQPGRHGANAGDLLLKVHILNKEGFVREGLDVYTTENIPYTTAVLGGEEYFKTLYGPVKCKVPAGTQSGSKIRLRHKGIVSMKNPTVHGDAYVTIQIEVPKNMSAKERSAVENLAKCQHHGGVA